MRGIQPKKEVGRVLILETYGVVTDTILWVVQTTKKTKQQQQQQHQNNTTRRYSGDKLLYRNFSFFLINPVVT